MNFGVAGFGWNLGWRVLIYFGLADLVHFRGGRVWLAGFEDFGLHG